MPSTRISMIRKIRLLYKTEILNWDENPITLDLYNMAYIQIAELMGELKFKEGKAKRYFDKKFIEWYFRGHNKRMNEILERNFNAS